MLDWLAKKLDYFRNVTNLGAGNSPPSNSEQASNVAETTEEIGSLKAEEAIALWLAGKDAWNEWAKEHEHWSVDFKGIDFKEYLTTQSKVDKEAPLLFEGFNFPGNVDFSCAIFNGRVNFCNATFNGQTNFYKAKFFDDAEFRNAKFGEGWDSIIDPAVDFHEAEFLGKADFEEAVFCAECEFNDSVDFRNTTFAHDVNFNKICVLGGFHFSESNLLKNVSFCGASFRWRANFISTNFTGKADFSDADFGQASPDFFKAVFNGDACFSNTNFYKGGSFDYAEFKARANLNFKETYLVYDDGVRESVSFSSAVFKKGEGPF